MNRPGPDSTASSRRIVPASGRSSPATQRSVVVLPHPEGPRSVKKRPSSTVKDTSSTARTPPRSVVKVLRSIVTCSIGSMLAHLPAAQLAWLCLADRAATEPLQHGDEDHEHDDEEDRERGDARVVTGVAQIEDPHREHDALGRIEPQSDSQT